MKRRDNSFPRGARLGTADFDPDTVFGIGGRAACRFQARRLGRAARAGDIDALAALKRQGVPPERIKDIGRAPGWMSPGDRLKRSPKK